MRVLLSGFEAFGGRSINPTAVLVENIHQGRLNVPQDIELEAVVLPVTFEHAFQVLEERLAIFQPDVILAFGLAAGRKNIELERVAINCLDADIVDNRGERPVDRQINQQGETAYFSTLPLRTLETALKAAGLPVAISNSAGTFVCNYLFYKLMETSPKGRLAGFIHVPMHPMQAEAGQWSLSEEDLLKAVLVILSELNQGRFI